MSQESPNAAGIQIQNLTKEYQTKSGQITVFENINLNIEAGSFVSLIGRSGCGKTTLLNVISGVSEPTSGQVRFEQGHRLTDNASLGYVFQAPTLLPWNTCVENIEYVHEDNPEYSEEVGKKYLDMVGLLEYAQSYPTRLSGGQKQRVGIARALSIDPQILLMDEPFSDLDEITATNLREELLEIWQQLQKTVVFVTHDITEAIELSDRIVMLGDGDIYGDVEIPIERPRSLDSEEFLEFRQRAIETFERVGKSE